jgi:hypothetical protein
MGTARNLLRLDVLSKLGLRPGGIANDGSATMGFFTRFFEGGLHSAIKNRDRETVKRLLASGSSPNEKRRKKTPLMIAARTADVETVILLFNQRFTNPSLAGFH